MPEPIAPRPRRARVLQWLLLALVLWLYGGDLLIFARAQTAEVSVLAWLPSPVLSALGAGLGLFFGVTLVRPVSRRVRQLALMAVLALLFIDLTFIASRRVGVPPQGLVLEAVRDLAAEASASAEPAGVLRDPRALRELLPSGPPPVYVKGERLPAWNVEVRERCLGPAAERGAAAPGTLIYCVSNDRQRAWITVVATEDARRFGAPALVSLRPEWIGQVAWAPAPADDGEDEGDDARPVPVWGAPTPGNAP